MFIWRNHNGGYDPGRMPAMRKKAGDPGGAGGIFLPVLRGAYAHRGAAGKADGGAGRRGAARAAAGCITRYPDLHLRIGKKDFFPTFAQYEQDNAPLLQELDACCAGYPGGAEALAGHAAAVMLDGLATHMEKDPRWGKRTRDNVFFDTKVALAIFFTPLLRKLQLELAEPLRTQLQTQWLARWPKQLWRPGDYDTLAGGFKKFRFCFITTATCAAEGKPDDCAELTAFRAFRDGWLRQRPDGPERIAEYYAVAPSIVAGVEYCDDAPARYAEIRARWLGPCYAALQRGEMERCYDTYRDMVQTLQERYGVQ